MSETIATLILRGGSVAAGYSLAGEADRSRHRVVESMLLALAAAEGGVPSAFPARAANRAGADRPSRSYFSDAEIQRGARFARPQLALAMARGGRRARRRSRSSSAVLRGGWPRRAERPSLARRG